MRRSSSLIAAALVVLLMAGSASAGVVSLSAVRVVSGPSPFAACTDNTPGPAGAGSVVYPGAEVEPFVAVNPHDATNVVAVFQQDRWSDGGSHGLVAGVSHDGGATYAETWPHFSICAGGTAANGGNYDRSSDPWVTFAPNGDAYLISLSVSADQATSAILVAKSTTGGDTWSEPVTLVRNSNPFGLQFNDKESITADPHNSNNVYAVWDRGDFPSDSRDPHSFVSSSYRQDIVFSGTTDGGATWEPARSILRGNPNTVTLGNQIVVLPDGTLLDAFFFAQGSGKQGSPHLFYGAIRSTDQGATWSQVFTIADDTSIPVVSQDTSEVLRTGDGILDLAVDQTTGTVYAVFMDTRFNPAGDIALSRSTDDGRHWSAPIRVDQTPAGAPAFTPSVEVAADGTVGVTYYDLRNNTPDPSTILTDLWFAHSHDGGATWQPETRLTTSSFDMKTAPTTGSRGFFVGDYEGLAVNGTTFLSVWVQTTGVPSDPTQVVERTITQ